MVGHKRLARNKLSRRLPNLQTPRSYYSQRELDGNHIKPHELHTANNHCAAQDAPAPTEYPPAVSSAAACDRA